MGPQDGFVLSPQQREAWLARSTANASAWRWTAELHMRGSADAGRLQTCMHRLAERYEILRTSYESVPGLDAPVQVVGTEPVLAQEHVERGDRAPLLRFHLPALSADFVSMTALASMLVREYAGEDTAQDGEPVQYADVAEWFNQLLEDDDTLAGREHWRAQAVRRPEPLRLPFLRPRSAPAVRGVGAQIDIALPDRHTDLARGDRLRPFLLAAWCAVLQRYSGQEELLLAVTQSGRRHTALANAIGCYARAVPLAVTLRGDLTFEAALQAVAVADAEAEQFQDYFSRQRWERDCAGCGGLDVGFDFQTIPALAHPAFVIDRIEGPRQALDLQLCCIDTPYGARAVLHYDVDRVDHADAASIAAAFAVVIDAADARCTIADLPLSRQGTRPSCTVESGARDVMARFADAARKTPAAPALQHGDERFSYAALECWSGAQAEALARLGVGPGSVVAIFLQRSAALVAAIWSALRAGAAYTVIDTELPQERIDFMLRDSGACAVLTEAACASRLGAALPLVFMSGSTRPARDAIHHTAVPAGTAYVLYTSGTTGRPKGVIVGREHLARYVDGLVTGLALEDGLRYGHVSTFAADLGHSVLFPALCTGGALHVLPRHELTDAEAMSRRMAAEAIDVLKIVPSHLNALLRAARAPEKILPRRLLITGGEALDRELLERIVLLPARCAIVNHYGPTETTVGATFYPLPAAGLDPRLRTAPIGRALGAAEIHVLDGALRELPPWVPGEVYIGGGSVALGYWRRPDLTAERFVPDPFGAAGSRMYRTGDLARRLPTGDVQFMRRNDGQVKIAGHRVELAEIEATMALHAGVERALALVDTRSGEPRVVVYVTGRAGTPDLASLRKHAEERLAKYLLPLTFVPLEAFPLTPNGKIDRTALAVLAQRSGSTHKAPSTDLERVLLRVWQEVLGVSEIGVADNFFESGGSSLRAIRLIAELERQTGSRLPFSVLLEAGTVEQLARLIEARRTSPAEPGQAAGERPFFCVHAGGGGVLAYAELARALAPGTRFVGIESPGLTSDVEMPGDLRLMARQYAAQIRQRQPRGPYMIGGWCLGGIIAHEIAQALLAQHETVGLLAIIDSAAPSAPAPDEPVYSESQLVERFAWHYQLDVDARLAALQAEERFAYLLERARAVGILPADAGAERLQRLLAVYAHNLSAAAEYARTYEAKVIAPCPVVLFRAEDEVVWTGLDASLGWSELYGNEVEIVSVPGNHHSMMRAGQVEKLAARLRGYLRRSDR